MPLFKNKIPGLCCYCRERPAVTKDHIPPKSIFTKPRPDDLITVPSCFECNNKASVYDERFKAYLGMHVARKGGVAEKLFKEGALPTARHNKKLRKTILSSMYPVYKTTQAGIITGKAMAVPWDNDAHDFTIERLVRGLYFHHYQTIIEKNIIIDTHWYHNLPPDFEDILYENTIANGQFRYHYNKIEGDNWGSIWLFNFYDGHFAGASIAPQEYNRSLK